MRRALQLMLLMLGPKGRRWTSVAGLTMLIILLVIVLGAVRRLTHLSLGVQAAITVGCSVVVAHAGMTLIDRLSKEETIDRTSDNEVVNATFAIVGTIYALMAGFVIVVVWQGYSETQAVLSRETNALADIERMSRGFPVPIQRQVQDAARTYATMVIDQEWPKMKQGQSDPRADAALVELWRVYTSMPADQQTSPLYAASVSRLNEMGDSRRERLAASAGGIPNAMWALLYACAFATLVLSYFFVLKSVLLRRTLATFLATVLALSLFLISALEHPFGGALSIEPDVFQFVLDHMRHIEY